MVSSVTIESSSVTNSANGIRVKTVSGATGSVKDVKFSDITLSGISTYGIVSKCHQNTENYTCSRLLITFQLSEIMRMDSPTGIPSTYSKPAFHTDLASASAGMALRCKALLIPV